MSTTNNAVEAHGAKPPLGTVGVPVELELLVKRVSEVPTLPSTVARILEITGDDTSSAADLAKVIYFDQALATKVLRIANSPFYGFSRQVKTLEHATVILGFKDIRNMALAMSVFSSFLVKGADSQFDRIRFWEHSLSCGLAAKVIAEDCRLNKTEFFVAGLIHDLGKVVLDRFNQDGFAEVLQAASSRHLGWAEAEGEVLGYTHADVALRLLESWKFPPELVRCVGFHHRPWEAEEPTSAAVIYLADMLTRSQGPLDYPNQPQPHAEQVSAALQRISALGLALPASFMSTYGGRLKGEVDDIQDYLDCIITQEMVP